MLGGIDEVFAANNPYPGNMNSNCTYAAWQKTKDILGIELPGWGNAWTWYSSAQSAGYSVGTTPRANSIVVFKQASWNSNYGHVAFVTEYNSSTGKIYKLEGNYNGTYHEGWAPAWESDMYGYIYLNASQVDDKTAPVIKNAHISNATTTSYDVRFNIYDNSTCAAQVGCWSDKWSIDKAKWYDVSIYGGDYGSITIPIADMGGYKDCWYYCNIYAWDVFGNTSKATTVKVFIDGSAPVIKNAHTTDATTTSYDVRFNIYDNSTCAAQVGCWSDKWSIDKAKWYDVSIYGGDYGSITIPIADMGGYKDCWYYCNIYAWDVFGNTSKATSVKVYICGTHKWDGGKVTKPATTETTGERTYTCTMCKATKSEPIPKLDPSTQETKPSSANPVNPANGASEGASAAAVTKYLTTRQDDSDAPGSTYGKLTARVSKAGKTSQKVIWNAVPGAVKYNLYANKCGKTNKLLFLGSVTGTSFTHKGLKKGTYYKYMVVAVDKNERVAASSKVVHSATAGGKVGNFKKVKTAAKKNKVNLKTGKKFKLKAKGVKGKGKVKKHRAICYESSNPAVATVSKKGIIKGVASGQCIVYAYAQNGVFAKIKVTVK